jgi:hypothetical protein
VGAKQLDDGIRDIFGSVDAAVALEDAVRRSADFPVSPRPRAPIALVSFIGTSLENHVAFQKFAGAF